MAAALVAPAVLYAQHAHQAQVPTPPATQTKPPAPAAKTMTDAQKIANAMSAAPAAIGKDATIMDWPAAPNGQPRQLRAGTNGWVCYPNTPQSMGAASGNDPMCLDKQWQAWADAWMSKKPVAMTAPSGIAYMLRGDRGASNTDPHATGPTPTNQWVVTPAHIMVLYADLKLLDAFPTDPKSGGPWVMWKGTPYAHLMVPVSEKQAATLVPGK